MATRHLPEEEKAWKASFSLFDSDLDGKVTWEELGKVLRALNRLPSERELKVLFRELDTQKAGKIDYATFSKFMASKRMPAVNFVEEQAKLVASLKFFDEKGTGQLDVRDVRQIMTQLGEPLNKFDMEALVKEGDAKGTGKIAYEPLAKYISTTS
eukprot:TRINITY_DN2381_c0_g1_i2.p2 TRINITY_DN2381_c0_g1~~TRINITY_DN2381_c0_g1_i2.p2  ORF type:complete len:155 (+),score=50.80 TRINITY_DN2381_c0_g1_i2:438-902(+)